jgi:hypothetical protein
MFSDDWRVNVQFWCGFNLSWVRVCAVLIYGRLKLVDERNVLVRELFVY